jgi:HlyD family secretion protein
MKNKLVMGSLIMFVAALTATLMLGRTHSAKISAKTPSAQPAALIAGPGRVEPQSEDIKLGSELSGKLKNVLVEEGDRIRRGQILAELENNDYRAQVSSAEAEVRQKEAELRKVVNGARIAERREAFSNVREAEAVMNNAHSEMERRKKLFAAGVISKEEADRYAKEYDVAQARFEETRQRHTLVDEAAREEDQSMAQANLAAAKARLDQTRAVLAKTYLRSPIDGTVLKKHHRAGESISNFSTTPDPIFTLGDTRALRVRIDVDEADVSKLAVGQRVYITADAYADKRFWGHVVRVGEELGRKNVRTDEPTERVDTKILETLVQLEPGADLPVGLRVNAFIMRAER